LFNLGRLATYCLIGLIAGAFGQIAQAAADRFGLSGLISIVAGTAALVFGLSIIGWMRDPSAMVATAGVTRLLVAFRSRASHAPAAAAPLLLGALQGWLPCALVYAAASRASLSGSATVGAATMLVFGLGTLPAVFALTVLPRPWLRRLRVHRFGGVLLAVLGVLLILRGLDQFGLVPSTGWW
jgi:sulfite exporter TauE/SafE